MKSKNSILFYAEYFDERGNAHYAIRTYHPTSGIVDMMKDFKDPDFKYPICDVETWKYEEEHKNFKRYVLFHKQNNKDEITVFDTQENRCIAKFYDAKLAHDYCERMNLDDKYGNCLDDDPWL